MTQRILINFVIHPQIMGACASKPKVLKGTAPHVAGEDIMNNNKQEGIVGDDVPNKPHSLSNLFKEVILIITITTSFNFSLYIYIIIVPLHVFCDLVYLSLYLCYILIHLKRRYKDEIHK